jgi:hypothetical protein
MSWRDPLEKGPGRPIFVDFPTRGSSTHLHPAPPSQAAAAVAVAAVVARMEPSLLCGCLFAAVVSEAEAAASGWVLAAPDSAAHLLCTLFTAATRAGERETWGRRGAVGLGYRFTVYKRTLPPTRPQVGGLGFFVN